MKSKSDMADAAITGGFAIGIGGLLGILLLVVGVLVKNTIVADGEPASEAEIVKHLEKKYGASLEAPPNEKLSRPHTWTVNGQLKSCILVSKRLYCDELESAVSVTAKK